MLSRICGLILMLLVLAGCSNETPTIPVIQDSTEVGNSKIQEEIRALPEVRDEGIRPNVEFEMNIQKLDNPKGGSMTRRTWKSAYRVDRAAQEFARDNNGWFATGISSQNVLGKRFIDYLPGGQLLKNAFTQYRNEPQDWFSGQSGSIRYFPLIGQNGYPVGYVIDAIGVDMNEVLRIEHMPD